jgi:hypothetical protein
VYALDIGQVMGSDKMPPCKDTDYEQWTVPADDHTPRCLLGELPGTSPNTLWHFHLKARPLHWTEVADLKVPRLCSWLMLRAAWLL